MGTLTGFLADHWPLALGAAAIGATLAMAYLTTEYLIVPACRLRAARRRGPDAVQALVARERQRLRYLEDEAAVLGEHGRPEAREIREEARFRRAILGAMERRIVGR